MKHKIINENNAQSILKKERELVFTESPVTDWVFEKTEGSPDVVIIPQNGENNEHETEFDPAGNNNTEIYGPPEVMGITDSEDWFKVD